MTRCIKANNYGCIDRRPENDWEGRVPVEQRKDTRFEEFIAPEWGLRALIRLLYNKINKGQNTIRLLINSYAPPIENNTDKYIQTVVRLSGINADKILIPDKKTLKGLVKGIIFQENSLNLDDALFEKSYALHEKSNTFSFTLKDWIKLFLGIVAILFLVYIIVKHIVKK